MSDNAAAPIQRNMTVPFQPMNDNAGAPVSQGLQGAGDAIQNFGTMKYEADQQSDLIQARLNANAQLDDLSQKYRTDPDPQTAPARYADDAAKIGQNVSGTLTGPTARQFDEEFGNMAESRRVAVQDISFNRQVGQARAGLDQTIEQSSRDAAFASNPTERQAALDNIQQGVHGLVSSGMLSPEEGQQKVQTANERLALFDGKAAIIQDPKAALTNLGNPQYLSSMDPVTRVELEHEAQAQIRVQARMQRMEMEGARMQAAQSAGDLHDVITSGLPASQDVIDQAKSDAFASGDPRAITRVVGLLRASSYASGLRGATPAEVNSSMAALENQANQGGANDAMATALVAARKFNDTMHSALATDPLMWASQQGVSQITPLSLNGQDAPSAFQARIRAAQLVSQHYGVPFDPLTQNETATLKAQLDKDQSPDQRLATLQMITKGFGQYAGPVLGKIGAGDPAIQRAGALVASGPAYNGTAHDLLTGVQLLGDKANEGLKPGETALSTAGVPALASAYSMIPGDYNSVISGADAIYAARALRQGLTGQDVQTSAGKALFNRSLQEAAGARYDGQGNQWGGIVQMTRNGAFSGPSYSVLAPNSVKADGFEDVVHNLTAQDLAKASTSGAAPTWEGGAAPDDITRRSWLVGLGNGVYGLSATNPASGQIRPVQGKNGKPFHFNFNAALTSQMARTAPPSNSPGGP